MATQRIAVTLTKLPSSINNASWSDPTTWTRPCWLLDTGALIYRDSAARGWDAHEFTMDPLPPKDFQSARRARANHTLLRPIGGQGFLIEREPDAAWETFPGFG